MDQVYRKAFITIAATWGSDSSKGCFIERDGWLTRPCPLVLASLARHEAVCFTYKPVILRRHGQLFEFDDINDPKDENRQQDNDWDRRSLNHRAWALQERILSPRLLSFERGKVKWRCLESSSSDRYPLFDLDTVDDAQHAVLGGGVNGWHWFTSIVSECTKLSLTKAEDRLIAFEGIA